MNKDILNYFPLNRPLKIPTYFKQIKIDVGLSHNAPNSYLWLKDKETIVLGFEPNPRALEMLKRLIDPPYFLPERLELSDIESERIIIFPIALSNTEREAIFYGVKDNVSKDLVGYDLGSSSLLEPKNYTYEKYPVQIFRLDSVLSFIDLGSLKAIDHLKVDAQGEDFKIVKGCGGYLKKIIYITVEKSVGEAYYVNGASPTKLQEFFDRYSFYFYMVRNGFIPFYFSHGNVSFINFRFLFSKNRSKFLIYDF